MFTRNVLYIANFVLLDKVIFDSSFLAEASIITFTISAVNLLDKSFCDGVELFKLCDFTNLLA